MNQSEEASGGQVDATPQTTVRKSSEGQEASFPSYYLDLWLGTRSYSEQRRILEAHPELLSSHVEGYVEAQLENFIRQPQATQSAFAFTSEQMFDTTQNLRNRLYLIRSIRRQGNTTAAIRAAYADIGGGYVLDYPSWLDADLGQYDYLRRAGETEQTAEARAALLISIIDRSQKSGSDVPIETLAEVKFILARTLQQYPSTMSEQADQSAIDIDATLLQLYTRDAYPYQYARIQGTLGSTYCNRRTGDQRANLEEAIASYKRALEVFTLDAFLEYYALTQTNLALVYRRRVEGGQLTNLQEVIACYKRALQVYTREAFPRNYADIHLSMGNVYGELPDGDAQTNLEEAIACYQRALQVYTLKDSPSSYARAQAELGLIYARRIAGERRTNLEEAIVCSRLALQVFTPDKYPEDYARLQDNLGSAYEQRIEGEREANVEEAIACYMRALQVYTLEAFPEAYAKLQSRLSHLAIEQERSTEDIEGRILGLEKQAFTAQKQGNHGKAVGLAMQALELARQHFGESSLHFAGALHSLAVLHHADGRTDQAIALLEQALVIYRATQVEDDYIATSLDHLAAFNQAMGSYAQAETLYLQALEVTQRAFGEKDSRTTAILTELAELYRILGNHAKVEEFSRRARGELEPAGIERLYDLVSKEPWSTPQFANRLYGLASRYFDEGNFLQAEPPLRQALAVYRVAQDQANVALCLQGLAFICYEKGDYATAESLYLDLSTPGRYDDPRISLQILPDCVGDIRPRSTAHHNSRHGVRRRVQKSWDRFT